MFRILGLLSGDIPTDAIENHTGATKTTCNSLSTENILSWFVTLFPLIM